MRKILILTILIVTQILCGAASAQMGGFSPFSGGDAINSHNLSDLGNATAARRNLGLGSLATSSAESDPVYLAAKDDNDTAMTRTGTGSATKWPTVRAIIAWVLGKGYLTAEADTLASVTARGHTTTTGVHISGPKTEIDNATITNSTITGYQTTLSNPVTGTGTQYYLPIWTSSSVVGALASLGSSGSLLKSGGSGANPAWTTETFAAPGAAGGMFYSDGTNWARMNAGATTEILVGGGAASPVWTTATGSGAPVRATSPNLTTPNIGSATGTSFTASKVNNIATQSLYYSNHLTDTTGAGWQGPISASGMAFSYYLILPEAEPAAGQMMVFGAPSGHLATGSWATPATMTGVVLANGTIPLTADYDVGNFALIGKNFTSKKVTSTPSQSLLYSSFSTDLTGAGWQGPTSAAGMANSYFVTMPEDEPAANQVIAAGTPAGHIAPGRWMTLGEVLLTTVNLALNSDGNQTIYTVPAGKTAILTRLVLVAGADAGSTDLTFGQAGALTDFLNTQQCDNANASGDVLVFEPIANATPVGRKAYAAGTVIKAVVANQAGGATNSLKILGLLY